MTRPVRAMPRRSAALTFAVPQLLHDWAESVFGGDLASDPAFWSIALRRGIDELEQQMPEVKAEVERESRAVCCATQISQALWRLDQNYPLLPNQERRRSVVSPETLWRS